ncbi:AraC family transcriptional regulator [Paraburkholderia phenazinium]|uniref:AraC family transcriptional regulator n=1 Tax=Paraburkholderia phenazinium TaxID=60549 RepID=A0A1N6I9D0_9BURK|nr:AraC family transcriptional regulator [Paraburkholderia phenazinium]
MPGRVTPAPYALALRWAASCAVDTPTSARHHLTTAIYWSAKRGRVLVITLRLRKKPVGLLKYGVRKYPATSALLASSASLGWSTLSAELRAHGACETPTIVAQHVEICLVIAGNKNSLVRRNEAGLRQEAIANTGAIWLSPAGVSKNMVINAPVPQTMHLYLPATLFDQLEHDFNLPVAPARTIRHLAGIRDNVIEQIGRSIISELDNPTPVARMYVETASLMLAARLLQKHSDAEAYTSLESSTHDLDRNRLRHVLEYVAANIKNNITLTDLAAIAGYSPFHFARKFTLAMGIPPHSYISRMRLENAMAELASGKLPLAEIAHNAHFSSQASFTRAFHRVTGMTPKEYQRRRR